MNLREVFEKFLDLIEQHEKKIVGICLSSLGMLVLLIVFFLSSDEMSVSDEALILFNNIEKRNYAVALENYQNWEKDFSESKMNRLDKSVTEKLNKLLLQRGDDYLNSQISKDGYIGLINTINVLDNINLDLKRIEEQVSRVADMYLSEDVDYEKAISYINTVSGIRGFENSLKIYADSINEIHESREIFEIANKSKKLHKYYEAIKSYEKVNEKDSKYKTLANENIKDCISIMYNYYIEKAEDENKNGNYEEAIKYISYLKEYYPEDIEILSLEEKYQENLSLYSLTMDDILNLIVSKSGEIKGNLSVEYFQQMIEGKKHYYVEVYKYNELIDEVLIDAKDKKIYSYKDSNKNYHNSYCDGNFRVLENGEIEFAITLDEAKFLLDRRIMRDEISYKNIQNIPKEKIYRYINYNNVDVDKILEKDADIYYYYLVDNGWFSKKEIYMINMYTKDTYKVSPEGLISDKEIEEKILKNSF